MGTENIIYLASYKHARTWGKWIHELNLYCGKDSTLADCEKTVYYDHLQSINKEQYPKTRCEFRG